MTTGSTRRASSPAGHGGRGRRRTRSYRPGEKRRQAILDAAIQLWSETGARGTGLTAVARQAGVTHSGLLHHFGSKSNLLVEVIAERQRRSMAESERAFGAGGLDVVRRLPKLAEISQAEPALAQLLHVLMAENFDASSGAHEYFVERQRGLRVRVAGALRDAQASGEMRADVDPDLKAAEIVALVDGAHVQWLLDPERISLDELLAGYAEALLRDLAVGSAGDQPAR